VYVMLRLDYRTFSRDRTTIHVPIEVTTSNQATLRSAHAAIKVQMTMNQTISYSYILFSSSFPYNPKGLLAVPLFTLDPVTPGRLAILAFAPTPLVDRPSGFVFVVARLPAAPVMSLSELPHSRTESPQPRDEFAILDPAPLPAPATPLPAAVTTAPAAFPRPDDAALTALPIPDEAAPMPFVSQLCCCGGVFLAGAGRGFFCAVVVTAFFCAVVETGFFWVVVAGL